MIRKLTRATQPTAPTQARFGVFRAVVIGGSLALLALLALGGIIWWQTPTPLEAPVSPLTRFRFFVPELLSPNQKDEKIVYGFLPYWNLATASINPALTHLSYFGLTVNGAGSLTQTDDEGNIAYSRLDSDQFLDLLDQAKLQNTRADIVIKSFAADDVAALLRSPKAQANFFQQLDALLLAYPFSGVNLDFEIQEGSQALQTSFTEFVAAVDTHLAETNPDAILSIDVYASAGSGENIWDLAALSPHTDYFVVMAYDFHRRNSPQAGPVAPLLGAESWSNDINTHLKEILAQVPGSQIILGIPFYGYEWQTTSEQSSALTFPDTGATATYKRVQEVLSHAQEYKVKEHWNSNALSPYLTYQKDGKQYVLYFDNPRSISYKLDYVNQLGLAGVAIWALGYEGDTTELWEVIANKSHPNK